MVKILQDMKNMTMKSDSDTTVSGAPAMRLWSNITKRIRPFPYNRANAGNGENLVLSVSVGVADETGKGEESQGKRCGDFFAEVYPRRKNTTRP